MLIYLAQSDFLKLQCTIILTTKVNQLISETVMIKM